MSAFKSGNLIPTLKPKQLNSLAHYIRKARTLDRSHAGTGKTPPSCLFTKYVVERERKRVVWIQQYSLAEKNRLELIKWSGIDPSRITVIDGTKEKREQLLHVDSDVFLIGAEAFNEYGPTLRKLWPDLRTIIVDEAHLYYGNFESSRTKKFVAQAQKYDRILFLTATPIKNGDLSKAYIYVHFMRPDYYITYKEFLAHHAVRDEMKTIVGWRNHRTLGKVLDAETICHTRKDVYGDIPVFIDRQEVPMLPKQLKAYQDFELEGLLDFEEAILDGREAGPKAARLRQILSHPHRINIVTEVDIHGEVLQREMVSILADNVKTNKEKFILDWLISNEQDPLIIFAPLIEEQERLMRVLTEAGYAVDNINGTRSTADRNAADLNFREGRLRVLIASPKTAGVGFNWGHVNTIIYHSLDYEDDAFTQSLARAIRGQRTIPLQLIVLEYSDSMDAHLMWGIYYKSKTTNAVDPKSEIIYFPPPKSAQTLEKWRGRMEFST